MRNKVIYFVIIIVILLVASCVICFNIFNNSNSVYCKTENNDSDKIELYYDFKDGKVYRYTTITTTPLTDAFDEEIYKSQINGNNDKYSGFVSKVWHNDNMVVITETYDLTRLTENEMKELTGLSIKELQSKSRKELIKDITPMNAKNFSCE